jgi:hypothetical protein
LSTFSLPCCCWLRLLLLMFWFKWSSCSSFRRNLLSFLYLFWKRTVRQMTKKRKTDRVCNNQTWISTPGNQIAIQWTLFECTYV